MKDKNQIKTAMILAAGLGTRMKDLTLNVPKPLLPIRDTTIIELIIKKLVNSGFNKIIINLHYKSELIREHLEKQDDKSVKLIFSEEPDILGTAGGIAKAKKYFNGQNILVMNSDIFSDISLNNFSQHYKQSQSIATMAVYPSDDNINYSLITYDNDQMLTGFLKKGQAVANGVNTGIFMGFQLLSEKSQNFLKPYYSSIIEDLYLNALRNGYKISVYIHQGIWYDLGTKQNYKDFLESIERNPGLLEEFYK
ncbi:MAG: nucleotidyltransferase family protein [Calditrichota bacterium]